MQKKYIPVHHRQERVVQKETTSKNISRTQLIKYIFDDFLRGFYIVGAIFLDGVVLTGIYLGRPALSKALSPITPMLLNSGYNYYMTAVLVLLEIVAIFLEVIGFTSIWVKTREK